MPQEDTDKGAAAQAVDDWKNRRHDKKLKIADECLAAIRLRGLDPRGLGITRAKIHSSLFCVPEHELDEIIERCAGPS